QPLTLVVLRGLLLPIFGEKVNYVNAPVLAKERGIEVTESSTAGAGDFTSLITLTVEGTAGKHSISGTLAGRKEPRIVEIDGYRGEINPLGNLIVFLNRDVPGVV